MKIHSLVTFSLFLMIFGRKEQGGDYSRMCGQPDSFLGDDDDMAAVKVANGAFEGLLAHIENVFDDVWVGLVSVRAKSVVGDEIVGERVGKVFCLLPS